MTGDLYIDSVDVYTRFGVFLTEGSYKSIVQWAALKKPEYNDWQEEDGIEVDLSDPVLDARNVTINFGCVDADYIGGFMALLQDGAAHEFNFTKIDKTYTFRLDSQSSKQCFYPLEKFSLKFIEDMPFDDYEEYVEPVDLSIPTQGYSIDDVDLSAYGIRVLSGTFDSVLKSAEVKENLVTKSDYSKGQEYDNEVLFFKEKDVVVKMLLHCSLTNFWNNYNALLYILIQPDERIFYIKWNSCEYPFYYKKSKVNELLIMDGNIWCEFDITLCFTSFRRRAPDILFALEDEAIVITEDDENAIDLDYRNDD